MFLSFLLRLIWINVKKQERCYHSFIALPPDITEEMHRAMKQDEEHAQSKKDWEENAGSDLVWRIDLHKCPPGSCGSCNSDINKQK